MFVLTQQEVRFSGQPSRLNLRSTKESCLGTRSVEHICDEATVRVCVMAAETEGRDYGCAHPSASLGSASVRRRG